MCRPTVRMLSDARDLLWPADRGSWSPKMRVRGRSPSDREPFHLAFRCSRLASGIRCHFRRIVLYWRQLAFRRPSASSRGWTRRRYGKGLGSGWQGLASQAEGRGFDPHRPLQSQHSRVKSRSNDCRGCLVLSLPWTAHNRPAVTLDSSAAVGDPPHGPLLPPWSHSSLNLGRPSPEAITGLCFRRRGRSV